MKLFEDCIIKTSDTKAAMGRRMGTRSLQIPLLDGGKGGDLNYPT